MIVVAVYLSVGNRRAVSHPPTATVSFELGDGGTMRSSFSIPGGFHRNLLEDNPRRTASSRPVFIRPGATLTPTVSIVNGDDPFIDVAVRRLRPFPRTHPLNAGHPHVFDELGQYEMRVRVEDRANGSVLAEEHCDVFVVSRQDHVGQATVEHAVIETGEEGGIAAIDITVLVGSAMELKALRPDHFSMMLLDDAGVPLFTPKGGTIVVRRTSAELLEDGVWRVRFEQRFDNEIDRPWGVQIMSLFPAVEGDSALFSAETSGIEAEPDAHAALLRRLSDE